jgi:uncharacterized protein
MDFRKIMRTNWIEKLLRQGRRAQSKQNRAISDYAWVGTTFAAVTLLFAGCKQDEAVVTTATSTKQSVPAAASVTPVTNSSTSGLVSGPDDPSGGHPQPKLPAMKLWVGTNEIAAELARTFPQIQTGMMRRTNMAEMEGMLFCFPQPHQIAFYMKNTLLPLSCAYIDSEGTILEIYDMKPLDITPIPSKSDQIQYVLEMNQGWFQRHGVRPGIAVATEKGTFPQTFRRR